VIDHYTNVCNLPTRIRPASDHVGLRSWADLGLGPPAILQPVGTRTVPQRTHLPGILAACLRSCDEPWGPERLSSGPMLLRRRSCGRARRGRRFGAATTPSAPPGGSRPWPSAWAAPNHASCARLSTTSSESTTGQPRDCCGRRAVVDRWRAASGSPRSEAEATPQRTPAASGGRVFPGCRSGLEGSGGAGPPSEDRPLEGRSEHTQEPDSTGSLG